jgi:hypothetical protein
MTDTDQTPEAVDMRDLTLQRYMVPGGHGIEPHPAGLLYSREQVDPLLRALAAENARLRAEMESGSFYQEKDIDAMQDELARLRGALSLYSCHDGCNDCPAHERDQVNCGWTARQALTPPANLADRINKET